MASIPGGATTVANSSGGKGNYTFDLIILTSLFFMWGFITCLNDILIPHLKNVFSLNYTQAMLIQFCFFGAYFLVSIPAGSLVQKVGYQKGIVIGLLIAAFGCILFLPAAMTRLYPVFLGGFFVLAAGITLLQVSANPFVAALGAPETASSRLTMTQAFNSLGTTVAPLLGAWLILAVVSGDASNLSGAELDAFRQEEADAVKMPYTVLAASFAVLAIIFAMLRLPKIEADSDTAKDAKSAWSFSHLRFGAIGIFLYVGAEVAIGSFLINFIGLPEIAGLQEAEAAQYVTYYWGGAMVGRFIGAVVMRYMSAGRILAFNSVCAVICLFIAIVADGNLAMSAIIIVGLFNSIMFPTIFSLAINGLGASTGKGSGILCLAIVGGAIIPLVQGVLADAIGVQLAFVLPVFCYLYICFYGLKGSKVLPVN